MNIDRIVNDMLDGTAYTTEQRTNLKQFVMEYSVANQMSLNATHLMCICERDSILSEVFA